jgi:hypothetical protein
MTKIGTRRKVPSHVVVVAQRLQYFTTQGGYSQNFLSQILKIFVTLTWILEPIKLKKGILLLLEKITSTFTDICLENHCRSFKSKDINV